MTEEKNINESVYYELEKIINKNKDKVAYSYLNNEITYQNLKDEIDKCSRSLIKNNIKQGDIVTICTPNLPQAIIMFYSLNKIGSIVNMIDPSLGENEICENLLKTDTKLILTVNSTYKKITKILSDTKVTNIIIATEKDGLSFSKHGIRAIIKENFNPINKIKQFFMKIFDNIDVAYWNEFLILGKNASYEEISINKNDPAVIIYGGEAVDTPHQIILSNQNLIYQTNILKEKLINIDKNEAIISNDKITSSEGLIKYINASLINKIKVILPSNKFSNQEKPTIIMGKKLFFYNIIHSNLTNIDLTNIKTIIIESDPIDKHFKESIDSFLKKQKRKINVIIEYGFAETSSSIFFNNSINDKQDLLGNVYQDSLCKIVKIGSHDKANALELGEICISSKAVMLGYFNDLKETIKILREHSDNRIWLHTGMIGYADKNGDIYLKTKLNKIISINDYNIYPNYIEEVLNKHKAVLTSIVIEKINNNNESIISACIILKKGYEPTIELKRSIIEYCKSNLPNYSLPDEYEYKKEIPKALIGKISYIGIEKAKTYKN